MPQAAPSSRCAHARAASAQPYNISRIEIVLMLTTPLSRAHKACPSLPTQYYTTHSSIKGMIIDINLFRPAMDLMWRY